MTKKMTERAKELGVQFLFETPVKKIIMEDGAAVGVLAVDKNGEEIEARAKSVIICTGGFGDNPEMIKEETEFEYAKTIYNFAIPGMKGDGIKMAWEAGSRKRTMYHGIDVSASGQHEPFHSGRRIPPAMSLGQQKWSEIYAGRPDCKHNIYRKCHCSTAGKSGICDFRQQDAEKI